MLQKLEILIKSNETSYLSFLRQTPSIIKKNLPPKLIRSGLNTLMNVSQFVHIVCAWKKYSYQQKRIIILYILESILLKEKNIKKSIEIEYDAFFAIGNIKMDDL